MYFASVSVYSLDVSIETIATKFVGGNQVKKASTAKFLICHTHYRLRNWWETVVLKTFTEDDWVENFRLSRATFHMLCERIEVYRGRLG